MRYCRVCGRAGRTQFCPIHDLKRQRPADVAAKKARQKPKG